MTFQVRVNDVMYVEAFVSPARPDHGFSLCALWIDHAGTQEDLFLSMDVLSKIFIELNPLGYSLALPKGEDSVEVTDVETLVNVMASDDMKRIGIWLATDDFDIDETQLSREISKAIVGMEI